jgi:hypothetical protein
MGEKSKGERALREGFLSLSCSLHRKGGSIQPSDLRTLVHYEVVPCDIVYIQPNRTVRAFPILSVGYGELAGGTRDEIVWCELKVANLKNREWRIYFCFL